MKSSISDSLYFWGNPKYLFLFLHSFAICIIVIQHPAGRIRGWSGKQKAVVERKKHIWWCLPPAQKSPHKAVSGEAGNSASFWVSFLLVERRCRASWQLSCSRQWPSITYLLCQVLPWCLASPYMQKERNPRWSGVCWRSLNKVWRQTHSWAKR